ncbi:MAG: hypothetical protein A3D65_05340 [Candidatus Lloydbacteria bacterium RIFCSPHIGHO2_02_FULL_50_13]|uniref:Uncharacterized protein n=1 Tax=Candidatus Lloydbacteria bacterium RIFCSPHIGHO2_02_FULL_50_13 TaxID=1798661 RepID=A0A1G2D8C3_9BACT|nr:MAG: hypothetical protein A3D65_05340 [Candidatus Lloydbacteria bacterium RIFCSPHIGHO2_02_FULL_50_13]
MVNGFFMSFPLYPKMGGAKIWLINNVFLHKQFRFNKIQPNRAISSDRSVSSKNEIKWLYTAIFTNFR